MQTDIYGQAASCYEAEGGESSNTIMLQLSHEKQLTSFYESFFNKH